MTSTRHHSRQVRGCWVYAEGPSFVSDVVPNADCAGRGIRRRVPFGVHSESTLTANNVISFAAARKRVAAVEKAGLLSKRCNGREQLTHGEVEAVRSVASMLIALVEPWQGRITRIDELTASLARHRRHPIPNTSILAAECAAPAEGARHG